MYYLTAIMHYYDLFSDWPKAYIVFFVISAYDVITTDYTIIMSRTLKVTGNDVLYDRGA